MYISNVRNSHTSAHSKCTVTELHNVHAFVSASPQSYIIPSKLLIHHIEVNFLH